MKEKRLKEGLVGMIGFQTLPLSYRKSLESQRGHLWLSPSVSKLGKNANG